MGKLEWKSRNQELSGHRTYGFILLSRRTSQNHPVPTDYFLPGIDHGGFGVMDTGGKGLGYSWFIFIGPPELRAKVPLADWNKGVEDYQKTHGGKARVEFSGPYPVPGREDIDR